MRRRSKRSTLSEKTPASFIAASRPLSDAERVLLRVLLVDDNHDFLSSAAGLLESEGLLVVGRAMSGRQAVRLAQALQPDVVLLDVLLGDEDGFDVAQALARAVPSMPVVLISTHPEDDLAEGLAESTAVGFLAKRSLSAAAVRELLA
jgi:two-component system nitrate/nitrite response regulator NarL